MNANFFNDTETSKIIFALNLLTETLNNGYKLQSLNINNDSIVFSNDNTNTLKEMKISNIRQAYTNTNLPNMFNKEPIGNNMMRSNTSTDLSSTSDYVDNPRYSVNTSEYMEGGVNMIFSETSDMSSYKHHKNLTGGSKNFFQKSTYSETSSLKYTDISNISATSTDIAKQIGGELNLTTTDTLNGISELKQKMVAKTPNLDMGIFVKKTQSGGAVDSIRRKMMDVGINSNSSTSSICE